MRLTKRQTEIIRMLHQLRTATSRDLAGALPASYGERDVQEHLYQLRHHRPDLVAYDERSGHYRGVGDVDAPSDLERLKRTLQTEHGDGWSLRELREELGLSGPELLKMLKWTTAHVVVVDNVARWKI